MIKKLVLTAMCAGMVMTLSAQNSTVEEKVEYSTDKYKVETNRWWSNWFVSIGGGAQVYFGDHDKQMSFGDRLAPAFDIAVGKWFTPGIGLRLMYSGLKAKGATQAWQNGANGGVHNTGTPVDGKNTHEYGFLYEQEFRTGQFHLDVLFNCSNLLCGYNENRIWNCTPYLGLGWARVYTSPNAEEVAANIGLLNSFRLSKALQANLDVRGMYVNDNFDSEGGGRFGEGLWSVTVGLTYNFNPRGWGRSKTVYRTDYGNLDEMREKLNEISAENARLKKALEEKDVTEVQTIIKKIAAANLVTFEINKTKLSKEARVNLGMLAEIIKQGDESTIYTITGYADAGTGSKEGNQRLSQKRAEAVYNCLVKEFGVNESQLKIDYKGGVENMFYNDPRLSRAVITRSE